MVGISRLALYAATLVAVLGVWQWWKTVDVKEFYAGKRIIVTGASRGLGREMALQLAQLGARLVISARSGNELSETVTECQRLTPDVYKVVGDMGKEEDCENLVHTAVEQLGGIDILIVNAAYAPETAWFPTQEDMTGEFLDTFRVNVMQAVWLTRAALPHLSDSHGSIIAISSGSGFFMTLHQEFVMTAAPVSITIMPLSYILTESAVSKWKPIADGMGFTVEDCAARVIYGITKGQLWYVVDWSSYFVLHFYFVWPELFDALTRSFVYFTSSQFANVTRVL